MCNGGAPKIGTRMKHTRPKEHVCECKAPCVSCACKDEAPKSDIELPVLVEVVEKPAAC